MYLMSRWIIYCNNLPEYSWDQSVLLKICVNKYRIMTILKVETDIITNISESLIGWPGIFVIMSVEVFRTDVIVFIGDVRLTNKLAHVSYELT